MKILHISPLSPYNEGWSYQENLLPKYQKKMGNDVWLVVSPFKISPNGKIDVGESEHINEDGVRVIRRRRTFGDGFLGKIISFTNIRDILYRFRPDFIMVHSLSTLSVFQAISYKKKINPKCTIIQDNHLDENIGKRKTKIITDICYLYWKEINKLSKKYVSRYYGVTPWRKEFIIKRYGIEREKTDTLIMGVDTDSIDFNKRKDYRDGIEKEYQLKDNFVIVSGGKIERNKNIIPLIKGVKGFSNIKLLIFGDIAEDFKEEVYNNLNNNVILVGWKNQNDINKLFLACDLAFFPGQHSVLWEQACGCGIPCVFKHWEEMTHLDIGGNCVFMRDVTEKTVSKMIESLAFSKEYFEMREAADKVKDYFSYNAIAKKSLECSQNT